MARACKEKENRLSNVMTRGKTQKHGVKTARRDGECKEKWENKERKKRNWNMIHGAS